MRLLINAKNKRFLFKGKDLHTNYGLIRAEDIKRAKIGDIVKSNKGEEFSVARASFIDLYKKIKRSAQIIPQKDIGLIITETGLNKESIVIEAGSGSGALGCFLAKICKTIYSYEIRDDFYKIVKQNIEFFGLDNMVLKNKDAKLGFDEDNADVVILDLPAPWEFIENAKKALKVGGFLVNYSPTIPQVMDFVSALDGFAYIKTSEILEREWEINKRKVRPRTQGIGHSGFLSFARKI